MAPMVIWIAVVPGAVRMVVETVLAFAENEKISNKDKVPRKKANKVM